MMIKRPKSYYKGAFMKNYFVGIAVAIILVVVACLCSRGTEKYLFVLIAVIIGVITNIIVNGVTAKKYERTIIAVVVIATISGILLFTMWLTGALDVVHDYFSTEYLLDYQLHGSYVISESAASEKMKTERSTLLIQPHRPVPTDRDVNYLFKKYGLEFLNETWAESVIGEEIRVMLVFGRELGEVKYKYIGYYGDGVTAKAEITFIEGYADDVLYVYFINKKLYFMSSDFYVLEDGKRIVLDNARFIG